MVLDDHSRVILKNLAGIEEGYINANYIEASIKWLIWMAEWLNC